jgi:hypothetical protein
MLVSPMETPVEIRYAGVVVARANEVRRMTVGGVDMFLAMPDPLPAGTLIALGNDTQARVEKVVESSDPSVSGIYVKVLSDDEATRPWSPCFREDEVPAPRPPAVVVSPVIVRPVHSTPPAPRPAPPPRTETPLQVRASRPAPEPIVETPLPEVVAVIPEPPAPAPFVAALPKADEQVAHFDPPPAVVENAMNKDWRRSTIVVAVPPPAERPPGAVEAVGEIDTGSRKVRTASQEVRSASIVVEDDHHEVAPPSAAAAPPPPAEEPPAENVPPQQELRLEDLAPARALPSARGRATKRRKTTSR